MTMTPHNSASREQIAKTVLMPGDPLRAKFIAETFLENPVLVNNVRGVQGHTGTWKGIPVTVMASGMGMPAMGIYSWELFHFYDVENIIRVGTAGSIQDNVNVRDIVIGQGACTNSNYAQIFGFPGSFAPIADYSLLSAAVDTAREHGAAYHVGNLFSSDNFYNGPDYKGNEIARDLGVLAVEMEAAALYANAAAAGKRALCICTVSNHIFRGEDLTPEERETTFGEMIRIALDTAVKMA
ncbi:MAG: purine-nucleoside phosphorylase [Oscillospiraceae bacterium]|nr:purine-nucleoside phosphorylase [Oscillospiraceae bacterium]